MPTDLEQQLPRFAEALDREAPVISVDEILGRGPVAVDVDHLDRPAWDQVPRVTAVSWGDADARPRRERRTRRVDRARRRPPPNPRPVAAVALKIALAIAAAAVLVVALGAVVRIGDEPEPADVPPSTVATPPTTIPVGPFVGVWLSTDTDGSSQTMEIVVPAPMNTRSCRDDAATGACCGRRRRP